MRRRLWHRHRPHSALERECSRSSTPPLANLDFRRPPITAFERNVGVTRNVSRSLVAGRHKLLRITDSDVDSLWSYGIVSAATWDTLIGAWGFCEPHAWVYLNIDMAANRGHLLGPAILYSALLQEALRAFRPLRFASRSWIDLQLRSTRDCLLCTVKPKYKSRRAPWPPRLYQARSTSALRRVALELAPQRRQWLCARCADNEGENRCRRHLLADISAGKPVNLSAQKAMLQQLAMQVASYERSFTFTRYEPIENEQLASLIAAIGWCSGWRPLLTFLK